MFKNSIICLLIFVSLALGQWWWPPGYANAGQTFAPLPSWIMSIVAVDDNEYQSGDSLKIYWGVVNWSIFADSIYFCSSLLGEFEIWQSDSLIFRLSDSINITPDDTTILTPTMQRIDIAEAVWPIPADLNGAVNIRGKIYDSQPSFGWVELTAQIGQVTIIKQENKLIANFELYQNYPNPFNTATKLPYRLKQSSQIEFRVYDTRGRIVYSNLFNSQAGNNEIVFNAGSLASGIYFYELKIQTQNYSATKKMILLK